MASACSIRGDANAGAVSHKSHGYKNGIRARVSSMKHNMIDKNDIRTKVKGRRFSTVSTIFVLLFLLSRQFFRVPVDVIGKGQSVVSFSAKRKQRVEDQCPPNNHTETPQKLGVGKFYGQPGQSGLPFLTQDGWFDIVDNKRTFFFRPTHLQSFPPMGELKKWIASLPHPVTFVMNNQIGRSWPQSIKDESTYRPILDEPNLHAIYVMDPREFPESYENRTKVKPLPVGLKWSFRLQKLFGEDKIELKAMYSNVSSSPEQSKKLFALANRTNTVWVRPMANSNKPAKVHYDMTTPALKTRRSMVCDILKASAPNSTLCSTGMLNQTEYFAELTKHRFVVSPAGIGLDSHSTWEALLAGCIPIVPKSPLNPMYEVLPVWTVTSWEEVTDEAVERVAKEMNQKIDQFDWEKVFTTGWTKEIYKGLCKMPSDTE